MPDKKVDFENFVKTMPASAKSIPTLDWYKEVQKQHKEIREIIGGHCLNNSVSVNAIENDFQYKNTNIKKSIEKIKFFDDKILDDIPELEDTQSLDVKLGSRKINLSTAISRKFEKRDAHCRQIVNNALSDIINEKRVFINTFGAFTIEVRTSSLDFIGLGSHQEVDSNSCFRDSSKCASNKQTVGQSKNTFIVLLKTVDHQVVARAWGFIHDKDTWILSNIYNHPVYCTKLSIVLSLAELLSEKIFNSKALILMNHVKVGYGVFHNMDGNFIISKNPVDPSCIKLDTSFDLVNKLTTLCSYCHIMMPVKEIDYYEHEDDNKRIFCDSCLINKNVMEFEDEYLLASNLFGVGWIPRRDVYKYKMGATGGYKPY